MSSTTNSGNFLNEDQKRFYAENGYLVVKNCVDTDALSKFNGRFQELCEHKDVPGTMTLMRDISIAKTMESKGERMVTKAQDLYDDPVLFEYCTHPNVVGIAEELIGTPSSTLVAMHTMLINKPPDNGNLTSRHPMHQDQHYFPFEPASHICCAWTAMEKINRENGCLVVVPKSHKGALFPHAYPKWEGGVNFAYHGIQDYDPDSSRVHVEMEAGDTVFFHPILIHGSGANRTKGYRKAISCHYANDDVCRYVENVDHTSDETLRDVVEMAKIRIKKMAKVDEIEVDYEDIWRLRARAVNGIKSHL